MNKENKKKEMKKKREINEENSVICIITLIYRNDIEKSLVIYYIYKL